MLVQCCYRLIRRGEVIHSVYDTDKREIIGLPQNWFQNKWLGLPEYSSRNYINSNIRHDQMCETMLLSNDDYALVVEDNNIGYYIYQFDGWKKFLTGTDDTRDSYCECYAPNTMHYVPIGFRRTQQTQLRTSAGIYLLTFGAQDRKVHTNEGVLEPQFDILSLERVDFHYRGYKEIVAAGYFAVVYSNGEPQFVQRVDNNLILVQP